MSSQSALAPTAHRRHGSRSWLALGAVSVLIFGFYGVVSVVADQEVMVRELGLVGFVALTVVAAIALLLALLAKQRATVIASSLLLLVAAMMCLGPLVAWLEQLAHPQFPGVLARQFVVPGLLALVLGLVGVVGGLARLRQV